MQAAQVHDVTVNPKELALDIKLKVTTSVLRERERELLLLKGPCRHCRLHFAHSGPCA